MPRKKPFSGKQKRQQLQEKKLRKGSSDHPTKQSWTSLTNNSKTVDRLYLKDKSQQSQSKSGEYDPNRYNLNFLRESREEIQKRKHDSQSIPITFVSEEKMEVAIEEIYQPGSVLDMPKRPTWKYSMSKEQLEQKEEKYFQDYLSEIHREFGDKNLSYFEHNLETWRQAWRVLEMSDIVVMVTDVRHPVLHFSPALYDHVVNTLNKPLILVLNKIDLVPASVIAAWTSYFKKLFPCLHVAWFTSFPQDVRTVDLAEKLKKRRKPKKRVYNTQIGPKELLQICMDICGDKVDLKSWAVKIENDLEKLGFNSNDSSPSRQGASGDAAANKRVKHIPPEIATHCDDINCDASSDDTTTSAGCSGEQKFEDGILTLGFVGHPNVGKSSLMNGLIGHKVVSTSVTPGHTKYFQTYFLTKTVKLCDSPGLVFPSLIHKQLQILSGIYPIAQVQEPYTPVGFLAARIPLVNILQLEYPGGKLKPSEEVEWTAWDISEAWANKRNYRTAKAARPDVYRAANGILRMAVDGRLCLYMRPPGYSSNKGYWEQHENTIGLIALQATGHFHGGLGFGEGKNPLFPNLCLEDLYSSDSVADSNSTADFSDDYDDSEESDYEEEEEEDDGDVTLKQEEFHVAANKFDLLAMDDDSD